MSPALGPALAGLLYQIASRWRDQPVGTGADLYAVQALGEEVCFAAGAKGTWARTVDGGHTWYAHSAPGAGKLDFRCLAVRDASHAFFLNTGTPARLYRTANGLSATVAYENETGGVGFFGLAFWDAARGLMVGDPMGGRFVVVRTTDGGVTWKESSASPPALTGERGLPAAGTALAVQGGKNAWFGTGGATRARPLRTTDGGATWAVSNVPLPSSPTGGIRAIVFQDASRGLAVGGDARASGTPLPDVARTTDG